jgi:putative ABC transport system substrate-binding protein
MRTLRLSVLFYFLVCCAMALAQLDVSPKKLTVVTFNDSNQGRGLCDTLENSLDKIGWAPGANLMISYVWAGSEPEKIAAAVKELSDNKADVILAASTGVATAVKKVAGQTPVVFVLVSDPVGDGFVESLEKPNGNMTGVRNSDFSIFGERLAITKEMAPSVKRLLVLSEPGYPTIPGGVREIHKTASTLGVSVTSKSVTTAAQAEQTIEEFARGEDGALAIIPSPQMVALGKDITGAATKFRLPAVCPLRSYVDVGGLASYGASFVGMYEQVAEIIDLVLRGKRPGEIPVQAPTKFEFLINRRKRDTGD